ncbi:MAG: glycosyltransferase family 2 protein [Rubrivivax sp.]|nr:glycosyltransferase family 2 protein [Rubrivivax sp.]
MDALSQRHLLRRAWPTADRPARAPAAVAAAAANRPKLAPSPQAPRRPLPSLSCVLPCRNEASNLAELLPLLLDTVSAAVERWEIIVVDDGSSDGTAALMADWVRVEGVRCLRLSRNFGKEAALSAGLGAAAGDVVVTMDADLQHDPALIPLLLERWRDGAEMVYAQRQHRRDEAGYKRLGARLFYALLNAADRFEVPAGAGDFRLMDRKVVDALLALPERNRFMKGLYAWVGYRAEAVPYMPAARAHGRTHYSPLRLLKLSIDGLTAFTTWPLRAVSAAGFVLAGLAFGYGAYLTGSYFLYGHDIGGWTTIVVSLMLFAGIQLVSLGIVGEYVGRIFEEAKGRPLYLVESAAGRGLDAGPA